MKDELRSLSLAVILSFIAIYTVNYFFNPQTVDVSKQVLEVEQASEELNKTANNLLAEEDSFEPIDVVIKQDKRIELKNDAVSGSIRLKGARFDNLMLNKYNVSIDDSNNKVRLFSPSKAENSYFAEFGWLSLDKTIKLPSSSSIWNTKDENISFEKPAILTWDNNKGVKIIRKISIDENYLFTITDTVENISGEELEIFPYALLTRSVKNLSQTRSVVHEGISAVVDGKLKEFKYSDIDKGDKEVFDSKGGWFGFSDRYWFSALITPDNHKNKITLKNSGNENYQIDYLGGRTIIPNGEAVSYTYKLYSGAKEIKLLDFYTKERNIPKFDLAVDFGWYYFLTKPFLVTNSTN